MAGSIIKTITTTTTITPTPTEAASERRFAAVLQHRYFLRVHMTAMLMLTLVAGVFADRVLRRVGLNVLAVRYFLSVAAAYAVFVSSVKLWLLYLGIYAAKKTNDWLGSFDFSSSGGSSWSGGGGGGSSSGGSSFGGGGGKFGGGGATGSWGDSDSQPSIVPAFLSSKSSGGGGGKSGGGSSDDLGELMLIVLVVAVLVAVIASFLWLIWAAPAILGETAFNAVLAGALAKHAHGAAKGSWVGSVVKKTAFPFGAVLVLATVLGWYAQHYCPDATRLSEAIHCVNPQ